MQLISSLECYQIEINFQIQSYNWFHYKFLFIVIKMIFGFDIRRMAIWFCDDVKNERSKSNVHAMHSTTHSLPSKTILRSMFKCLVYLNDTYHGAIMRCNNATSNVYNVRSSSGQRVINRKACSMSHSNRSTVKMLPSSSMNITVWTSQCSASRVMVICCLLRSEDIDFTIGV